MRYTEILEACWSGYQQQGMKKKGDRMVPNCVPVSEQEMEEDLRKWFKEKWVRFGPDGKIRGACARGSESEGKPKCLPQSKAHALGKKGRASAAAKKRREDPNAERRGPARNVATKVREGGDDDPIVNALHADDYGMPGTSYSLPKDTKTGYRVSFKGRIIGVFDTMPKATEIAKRLEQKYGGKARVEATVAEAQTDYQKRRQREREVDAGRPVKPLPKNPKTDYQKRREQQRRDQDMGEAQLDEKQDACYRKVKSRYKVWPSAYASGALVQCRKKGAANWGTGGKKK